MTARLSRRPALVPILLAVFFGAIYLLSGSSDLLHNGDTDLRYQTTQSIVDFHRLWIAHPMWLDTRVDLGRGGHLYAFYAPGQTVLMVPLYIFGKVVAHHLALPYDITTLYACRSLDLFLGALLAVLFFLFARSLGYPTGASTVLTLIFGLGSAAWPDAQSALEQTQVDLFLLLAVYSVWRFLASDSRNRLWLALAGCAAGVAVFTRYDAALYLPIVLLFLTIVRGRAGRYRSVPADWLVFAVCALPWVGLVGLWDVARFGSVWSTGLHEATWGEPFWRGLLGLTLSPGKGLVWYVPLVFLLPLVARPFFRRAPLLSLLFAALVATPLLFYSNLVYWHGDPAWGPRYLYTALPYVVLPLGELLVVWRTRSRRVRLLAALLVLFSLAVQTAAVSVTQWRFWYRLEAMEEQTSQPFQWGASHYHYYWTVAQSPILMQLDDVYQVARLQVLGDRRYLLVKRPTALTATRRLSNPADVYPVNTLSFWWADDRHPLLGARARAAMALALALAALGSLALLALQVVRPYTRRAEVAIDLDLSSARRVEG